MSIATAPGVAVAQSRSPESGESCSGRGHPWPRVVTSQGATLSIYQPQIDTWSGNVLKAYAAVKVKTAGKKDTDYGVIWFTANTEVDKVNRVVTLDNFDITKQSFPTLANNGAAYASALDGRVAVEPDDSAGPAGERPGDLRECGSAEDVCSAEQSAAIIYSTTPAVLALIDGKPVLGPEQDHLQKVINTRALIVYDTSKYTYYLALMDGWMDAPTIEGPYTVARHAPSKDLEKIKTGGADQRLEPAAGESRAVASGSLGRR